MTAKEIARMLGVSPATVSMVINNKPGVSEERRAQIMELLDRYNYQRDKPVLAEEERNLGFVVYKNTGDILGQAPFFELLMEGVSRAVSEQGYNLMFMQIVKDGPIREQIETIRANRCAGLIIYATEAEENDMAFFRSLKTPFVILLNDFSDEGASSVCINNRQGIVLALRCLYKLGHRKIGYIRSRSMINSFAARYFAYTERMAQLGLLVNPEHVVSLSYSQQQATGEMKDWLQNRNRNSLPTAFLADNDLLACGAMSGLTESGLCVPQDISVIGFDDRPMCALCDPPLTTVVVPRDVFGPTAVQLLMRQIKEGHEISVKMEIGVSLMVRGSTGPAKAARLSPHNVN